MACGAKELVYLRGNTNAQHLIVTAGFAGFNWHLDFPPPGTVTQVDTRSPSSSNLSFSAVCAKPQISHHSD
jgi:hypothetical protein